MKTAVQIPSKFQQKVYDHIQFGYGHLAVQAVAGSGKTTTLIKCLEFIPKDQKIIFIAFSKAIVEELRLKLAHLDNVQVSTVHSVGMTAVNKAYGKPLLVERKIRNIIDELKYNWKDIEKEDLADVVDNVKELVDLARVNVCKTPGEIKVVAEKYGIDTFFGEIEKTIEVIKISRAKKDEVDFTDMIYFPAIDDSIRPFQFQWVFVDEAQDLNVAQQVIVKKLLRPNGRVTYIGDEFQCQPKGTKVLLSSGEYKNIEDIKAGDMLSTYSSSDRGTFRSVGLFNTANKNLQGRQVNQVASREINEDIIYIKSGDKLTKYTKNHITYVRFRKDVCDDTQYCVYLMRQGDRFRIGISRLFHDGNMGPSIRTTQEHADCYWILKVVANRHEAQYWEYVYMVKYGIPDIVFRQRNKSPNGFSFTQEEIDSYYKHFEGVLYEKASKLLMDLNMDIKYPFHSKSRGGKMGGRNKCIEIFAANIIPHLMLVGHLRQESKRTIGKKRGFSYKPSWEPIDEMTYVKYKGLVYSLDVDVDHNYVADGILTHNCIFGFAGADTESFAKIRQMPNMTELPLSCTYRCAKSIVEYVKSNFSFMSHLEAFEGLSEGQVNERFSIKDVEEDCYIMCRNTMPLVKCCLEFLAEGKKAFVKGTDIGLNLIKLIDKADTEIPAKFAKFAKSELEKLAMKIRSKNPSITTEEIKESQAYVILEEKINVIELIRIENGCDSMIQVKTAIEKIFKNDKKGYMFCTMHKSKGLESEHAYILPAIPSKRKLKNWEKQQEENLLYVAYTRGRNSLSFITDWKF